MVQLLQKTLASPPGQSICIATAMASGRSARPNALPSVSARAQHCRSSGASASGRITSFHTLMGSGCVDLVSEALNERRLNVCCVRQSDRLPSGHQYKLADCRSL